MTELAVTDALPKPKRDLLPVLLPVILALAMIPLIGSGSSWLTLTAASFAMGMMIFIMASGLTLVFGLMDVLNFGHGAFIAVGAYIATLVLLPLASWVQADSLLTNLAVLLPAALAAMAVSGALGAWERGVGCLARAGARGPGRLPLPAGVVLGGLLPPMFVRRVPPQRAVGRDGRRLLRLPGGEAGAGVHHPSDRGDAVVEAA